MSEKRFILCAIDTNNKKSYLCLGMSRTYWSWARDYAATYNKEDIERLYEKYKIAIPSLSIEEC